MNRLKLPQNARLSGSGFSIAGKPSRGKNFHARSKEGLRTLRVRGVHIFGTMKDEEQLRAAFAEAGVDTTKPVISSCGSGVTAAVLDLALEILGTPRHAVYDGSWAEWGMYNDLKVATGDA